MGRRALVGPPDKQKDPGGYAVWWINNLTHTKGEWAGHDFSLRPWQADIVRRLFGAQRNGRRQFRTCYVEIPRKNGKTELAAAIALYMLLGDEEAGAEVYSAAVDLEQASLAFNVAAQMVRNDEDLRARLEIVPSRRRIVDQKTGSFYRAIPADAASAHGYNASAVIYDELHAAPNRELYDVLTTSMGARRQPLTFIITTAGYDRTSICWEMHEYAERVKRGIAADPSFLPVLYGAPDDAPWLDEAVWRAANPALDDFRSLDEMRIAAARAKEIPAQQNSFRRLYLCQWTEQHSRWLDMDHWAACGAKVSDADLIGAPCYAGLDLGMSDDLSAFARVWPLEDGRIVARMRFWIPAAALSKYRTRPYSQWQASGDLVVTEGEVTDLDQVEREVGDLCRESGVLELAYDKRFAAQMALHLEGLGLVCVDTPQGYQLNEPLRAISDAVVTGRLCHGGDPILAWNASHAVVRHGQRKEIRLDKDKAGDKIDGLAALAMAMDRVIRQRGGSVYETRGLEFV